MMTGEGSLTPRTSTVWSRFGAPASSFRRKFDRGERRLVASHGDLVARGAVDHVEYHARKAPARELAQRGDAVSLALQGRCVHQAFSRYALIALSRKSLRFSCGEKPEVAQSSASSQDT